MPRKDAQRDVRQCSFCGKSPEEVKRLIAGPTAYICDELSLSRLNYWLPRGQAHPEVVQGTAEFHHQITDALLPR